MCDEIEKGISRTKQITIIDGHMEQLIPRVSFGGPKGADTQFRKGFEDTCFVLEQNGIGSPRRMSTLTFYQACEKVREQLKKNKRNSKK